MLQLVVFCIILHTSTTTKTYNCSTKNVNLNFNELAFFETTNFPKMLSNDELLNCNITFNLAESHQENSWIYAVFKVFTGSEGFVNFVLEDYPSFYMISQNSSLSIPNYQDIHFFDFLHFSIQALIIFGDDVEACPLEAVCNPFKFDDETQIIHIRSAYLKYQNRKLSCRWRFSGPDGYGFKIFVQNLNISTETSLLIENSTQIILNERSVKFNFSFYNSDSVLTIHLSRGSPYFVTEMEFQAYISVVKNFQKKLDGNCTIERSDNKIIWSNHVYPQVFPGYQNNIQCEMNFTVPTDMVAIVQRYRTKTLTAEYFVDTLKYFQDEGRQGSEGFLDDRVVIFEPFKNGTNKTVTLEFVSDGSVQGLGFQIFFYTVIHAECECGEEEAGCSEKPYYLMDIPYNSGFYDYYCGNLNCKITILPCSTDMIALEISLSDYEAQNIFKVYSNDQVVFDMDKMIYYKEYYPIFLSALNKNLFEVRTFPSSRYRWLSYTIRPFSKHPVNSQIVVSKNISSIIIDTAESALTLIDMDEELQFQKIGFVFYCVNPNLMTIFKDANMTMALTDSTCFPASNPLKCELNENKFFLYSLDIFGEGSFTNCALRLSSGSRGCVFKESIFAFDASQRKCNVAALANDVDYCLIILFLSSDYQIQNLFTTSKNENVKVYVGRDQEKLFFEFNSNTIKYVKNSMFFTNTYSILIPKNTAFYIEFVYVTFDEYFEYTIYNGEFPYPSIIATEGYQNSLTYAQLHNIKFSVTNFSIIFTILDYDLTEEDYFYFSLENDETINVQKTGDQVIFNQSVFLQYEITPSPTKGGILFIMQVLNSTIRNLIV